MIIHSASLHDKKSMVSARDPDPGYGVFLPPNPGKKKNPDPGTEMNIPDHFSERLETVLLF